MVLNTSTATMTTQAQELVQGVENMQITYGIDPAGDGVIDRYMTGTSANIGNWNQVVAVRISLRMRSLSPVYNVDTPYGVFGDTTGTDGSDRFMRQTVSTTIKIRN
jgi:type IV pilus assembly protein PilW